MLFDKPIADATEADLIRLVDDSQSEGLTLDFKRDQYEWNDAGTREFLADVSSFANARGGVLLIGLNESDGCASEVCGVDGPTDPEVQRMNAKLESGLEPRLRGVTVRAISLGSGKFVIAVEVPTSWERPHMVTFKGSSRFWGRTSSGKYPLNTADLRTLFVGSSELVERIRRFRLARVADILAGATPIVLSGKPRLILHAVPFSSLERSLAVDLSPDVDTTHKLRAPMCHSGWEERGNFDGLVTYTTGQNGPWTYLQIYRNGTLEAVDCLLLQDKDGTERFIPNPTFDHEVRRAVDRYRMLLKEYGVTPPVAWLLTLADVQGYTIETRRPFGGSHEVDRHTLVVPEVIQESEDDTVDRVSRQLLDPVWHACGWVGSSNFDKQGVWKSSRRV